MDAVPHPPPRPPDRRRRRAPARSSAPAAEREPRAHPQGAEPGAENRPAGADAPRQRRQRLAAYAVICRPGSILLVRLARRVSPQPRWTLPGGGVEFGEHPREAVVREVMEETGLAAHVGEHVRVYSGSGTVLDGAVDQHSVRLVYDAWVALDAPAPRTVEVDGSTVEARWVPWEELDSGEISLVAWVREAVAEHRPVQKQRLSAYALATRQHAGATQVLLTRIGDSIRHGGGLWTLPGGGVEHGENPAAAVRREVAEEAGIRVGAVRYHASQPWPLPHSLMLGCYGEALNDHIVPDEDELEDVRWVSRDELHAMREDRHPEGMRTPPPGTIARLLFDDWLDG